MGRVRFAHIADVHLGAFREPKLREANLEAFLRAMDICRQEKVDFILLCGDLFDSPLPDIGIVERATARMRESIDAGLPIYMIYGSHDFSASERSIVDVLRSAGVFIKAANATEGEDGTIVLERLVDERTGTIIAGISGRKLGLDRAYYERLDARGVLEGAGPRIFAFHAAITELKPKELAEMSDTMEASLLPKGFDYYAGGHIHRRMHINDPNTGMIVYPGPLFGDSYRDLEGSEPHGFYIVTLESGKVPVLDFKELRSRRTVLIEVDAGNRTAADVSRELRTKSETAQAGNAVVLVKVRGELSSGKPGDIDTEELKRTLSGSGAHVVYVNRGGLSTKERSAIKVEEGSREEVELKLLREHLAGQPTRRFGGEEGLRKARALLRALGEEQKVGTKADHHEAIVRTTEAILFGEAPGPEPPGAVQRPPSGAPDGGSEAGAGRAPHDGKSEGGPAKAPKEKEDEERKDREKKGRGKQMRLE